MLIVSQGPGFPSPSFSIRLAVSQGGWACATLAHPKSSGGREAQGYGPPRDLWPWVSPLYLPRVSVFWVFLQNPRTPPRMGGKEREHFEGS